MNEFVYNLILNYVVIKTKEALLTEDKDKLERVVKNKMDIVGLLRPYISPEFFERIPASLRQVISDELIKKRKKFVADYIDNLAEVDEFKKIIKKNNNFLQENGNRLLNIVIIEIQNLDNQY